MSDLHKIARLLCLNECTGNDWGTVTIDRSPDNRSVYRVTYLSGGEWHVASSLREALKLADEVPDNG